MSDGGRTRSRRRWLAGLAGAAVLVAVVTVFARLAGFGRWFVFSKTVGDTCLGDAYNTANQLPNVAFEVVAGGALASVVVPVLSAALARQDKQQAGTIMSALFTWTLAALTPVVLLGALLAEPYARLMVGDRSGCGGSTADTAAWMLLVFVPQIWFYGLAVVASGALQATRHFVAPAAAPLASSLVVGAAYVGYAVLDSVPVLAAGTTVGVVALALTVLIPLRRTGLRFRPTFRFPEGTGRQVRSLALAGLIALLAQQGATLLITWLANHRGAEGTLTLYTWAFAIFMLPYAVLAAPIATTAFPRASSALDPEAFARFASLALRMVVLAGAFGGALLGGTALPVARVFVLGPGGGSTEALAYALVAFALAVPAFGVVTLAGRLLYARSAGGLAAGGTAFGWIMVGLAAVVVTSTGQVAAGLGAAMSCGLLLGAVALLFGVVRVGGAGALAGFPRALLVGAGGGVLAGAVAYRIGAFFTGGGLWLALAGAIVCAVGVILVFGGLVAVLDRDDARQLLARLL
ncbi:murein biosynthesis integral membrane protein MurJ [Flindersiella endophytica]